ncbi:hypothetical protein ACH4M4_37820 [Streptomyces sp. NPDC017254]|uniref:hypothetical protein n=1 Tax=unclassified Streptomyces TaxID=2593676 RepID=UPI0037B6B009
MSFDDEWAGIKTVTHEQQTAMRLNQLDGGGGGGGGSQQGGSLRVEQADLAAVGDAATQATSIANILTDTHGELVG